MEFSEYVIVSSFDETQIVLQNSSDGSGFSLRLSGGTIIESESLQVVVLLLSDENLDSIKIVHTLAQVKTTLFYLLQKPL